MIVWLIWFFGVLAGFFVCDTMHTNRRSRALLELRRSDVTNEIWKARMDEIDRLSKWR